MSSHVCVSQCGGAAAKGLAPRQRLVVDPIWKVTNAGTYNRFWECLTREAELYGFVGFDMEWTTKQVVADDEADADGSGSETPARPRRKPRWWTGPVATIQLSTFSRTLVVRWNHLHALVSGNDSDVLRDPYAPASSAWPEAYRIGQKANLPTLLRKVYDDVRRLIASPDIFLVGVGIHGDEVKLRRDYPKVVVRSAVELTALAEACLPDMVPDKSQPTSASHPRREVRTDSLQSLKKITSALTGKELGKDMAIVMSDWGGCHGPLTPLQIEYSAGDSEASYDVCVAILSGGGFLSEAHTSTAQWKVADKVNCREVLACCATEAEKGVGSSSPTGAAAAAKDVASPSGMALGDEEKAEAGWCKGRSKPYYDNIAVYSTDMQLVFPVDRAKADWYVNKKGLATVLEWRAANGASSPTASTNSKSETAGEVEVAAIQLKFAPDFARYNDAHIRRNLEYFQQPKENICVVCGGGGSLVRFAVVPLMYRRFFPSVYMRHNSYDLLLLCPACFAMSRQLYDRQRLCVADDFGIPLAHLRGEQREAYGRQVAEAEKEVVVLSNAFIARHDGSNADGGDAAGRDCDLDPRLRLQGMQDYLALMEHREVLDKVFSYAKALHAHYLSLAPARESLAEEHLVSHASLTGRQRGKRRGNTVAAAKPTAIPEARRQMMADFLRTHAPSYAFYAEAAPGSAEVASAGTSQGRLEGAALQDAVFGGEGPASFSGVQLILTGRVATSPTLPEGAGVTVDDALSGSDHLRVPLPSPCANSSRGVLSRYWFATHPQLLATLPTVTRQEERQRDAGGKEEDDAGAGSGGSEAAEAATECDASGVPYVDSHAFVVLQMLLRKYEEAERGTKTAEHAVGQFIYRWRACFVEGMQPQHLPRGWVPEDGILR